MRWREQQQHHQMMECAHSSAKRIDLPSRLGPDDLIKASEKQLIKKDLANLIYLQPTLSVSKK